MRDLLRKSFQKEGLELLGAVPLGPEQDFARFESWIDKKFHAGMIFLEENHSLRKDPRGLLPEANTAIIFAMNYYLGDRLTTTGPRIAQYARFRDYHKAMRKKAEQAWATFTTDAGLTGSKDLVARVCIDSAPILERALAARTSAGFIGKNTLYIHPQQGSFLLLGEVLTSLELPYDEPGMVNPGQRTEEGGCGSCRRCQVHCPTGALDTEYRLDANKCLSYWSIEHRGTVPEIFWPHFAKYWFGCDICQLACPYNRQATIAANTAVAVDQMKLFDVATMDEKFYVQNFGGTPLTRAKHHGLRRNALIAMTVTSDPLLNQALERIQENDHSVLHETKSQIENFLKQKTR